MTVQVSIEICSLKKKIYIFKITQQMAHF
uniref:Uncharacterized protein n=1 Tax=Lepeophtheirus salmonis TaxID=72036 RepID=A0A0K2V6I3_LEPSM